MACYVQVYTSIENAVVYFLVSWKGYILGHIHECETEQKNWNLPDIFTCSLTIKRFRNAYFDITTREDNDLRLVWIASLC